MKKLIYAVVLLSASVPAFAVTGSEVQLRASTLPSSTLDSVGQFDTTVPQRLIFHSPNRPDLTMPYAQITEFTSRHEVTHHLGLLAFIVVGLIKPRQQRHLISIAFTDTDGSAQVATFEVGKNAMATLLPVLQARARNACERQEFGGCTPIVPPARRPITP